MNEFRVAVFAPNRLIHLQNRSENETDLLSLVHCHRLLDTAFSRKD